MSRQRASGLGRFEGGDRRYEHHAEEARICQLLCCTGGRVTALGKTRPISEEGAASGSPGASEAGRTSGRKLLKARRSFPSRLASVGESSPVVFMGS